MDFYFVGAMSEFKDRNDDIGIANVLQSVTTHLPSM